MTSLPAARPRDPDPLVRRRRRAPVVTAAVTAVLATSIGWAPAASAVPSFTATGTTVTAVAAGRATTLPGVSVTGAAPGATLQVTLSTDVGSLSLATTTGLTLAYGYTSYSGGTVSFTGSQSDTDADLASLALTTAAGDRGATAHVSVTAFPVVSGLVYSPSNQHYYRYLPSSGISWTSARTQAAALSYGGQAGYLATIPSDAVNSLVASKVQGASNVWFGAQATLGSGSTSRTWAWVDGPRAGNVVTTCSNVAGACASTTSSTAPGAYSHWATGEPNNYNYSASTPGSGEFAAVTNWQGTSGNWNDLATTASGVSGYLAEFGDLPSGSSTPFNASASASSAISVYGPPDAPTGAGATVSGTSAAVTWTAPAGNGGSPVTGYTVTAAPGGATCTPSPAMATTCTVTGLTAGTAYTFTVRATNDAGTGPASAPTGPVTATGPAGAVTNLTATPGDGSARLSFSPPADTGGSAVTGYQYSLDGGDTWLPLATTGSAPVTGTVTGLTNGTAYQVEVRARSDDDGAPAGPVAVTPRTVPDAPAGVEATGSGTSATVTWSAPGSDGGSPVTGYAVTASQGGATCTPQPSTATTCTVTGLTPGTAYTFTVTATNAAGTGAPSAATDPVTAYATPGPPVDLAATPGDTTATLTFTPAAGNGSPVTGYEYSLDGGDTWLALTTTGSAPVTGTVTGLTDGTPYDIEVRATNAAGSGPAAGPVTVTPHTTPGAPTALAATPGDGSATLSFQPPAGDGGSAVTGYQYSLDGGDTWLPLTTTGTNPLAATVTGLTNGTSYDVEVRATNAAGGGAAAGPVSVTPRTVPEAPTDADATTTGTSATVTWSAPVDDGGSPVTGYTVTASPGGATCTPTPTTATSCTVTGLTPGTAYTFTVTATNVAGTSSPSDPAGPVTPLVAAGPPTGLVATPGDASAALSFSPPADDGGSPVTGYQVTVDGGVTWTTLTTTGTGPVTATLSGLTNGQLYLLSVRAVTAFGPGAPCDLGIVVPRTVPGAPVDLVVTPGDGAAQLTFGPPADDGGTEVTRYEVSLDGGESWAALTTFGTGPVTATLTGLTDGTPYSVLVRADNAAGPGPAAPSQDVTPRTTPGAPRNLVAVAGNATASLTFSPPTNDGGSPVTGYEVSLDGHSWSPLPTSGSDPLTATVTGLSNGRAYGVWVRARNDAGTGPAAASVVVTPRTVPGAPALTGLVAGNGQLTVTVVPPGDDGGAPVTGYTVTARPGGATATLTGAAGGQVSLTGLTNGTAYTLTVVATNEVGDSAPSAGVTGTPDVAVPPAPEVTLTITGGRIHYSQRVLYSGRATLAGRPDGGAPVTVTTHDATGATRVIARGTTRPDGSFSAYTTAVYNATLTASVSNGASVGTARVGLPVRVGILYTSASVTGRAVTVTGLSFPGYSGPATVHSALVTVGADGVFRRVLVTGVVDQAVPALGVPYQTNPFTLHVTLPPGSYRLAGAVGVTPWNGPSYGPTLLVTVH